MAEKRIIAATVPLSSGFTHILFNLAAQGFEWIKINYCGSGDSGSIDEIELVPTGALTIEDGEVDWIKEDYEAVEIEDKLKDLIENVAYDKVLNSADDWYNNEGGGGTLYINTMDATYHGDHYVNVTETIDSVLSGKLGDDGPSNATR